MIDTGFVEQRMREANPVPGVDHIDTEELSRAIAAARTGRATVMQAPSQHQSIPTLPPQRRRAWAFAAAFVLVLVAVGVSALILQGDAAPVADEPAVPTASAEEPDDWISVDSLSWSRINLGTQGPGLQITAGGPGLVAVGVYHEPDPGDLADGGGGPGWVHSYLDLPTVWTSQDGYEWSQVPSGDDRIGVFDLHGEVAGIAGSGDLLVAVAENYAWTSPDGLTWSRVPDGTFRYNVDRLLGVIAGGPGFVAFGKNEVSNRAAIWTSPDGYTWTRVPDDPAVFAIDIHAMTVGGPGLVAVGSSHEDCKPLVLTSTDGYNWTRLPPDPTAFEESSASCGLGGPGHMRIRDVSTGGPGLVAVGSRMEQATVWTSRNGMVWSRVPDDPAVFGVPGADPHTPYSEMTGVAAVGDGLVAIGRRGGGAAVWISQDGSTWTDVTDEFDLTGNALTIEVVAGGPGAVILGEDLIADYTDRPPLMETVIWVGSPSEPTE